MSTRAQWHGDAVATRHVRRHAVAERLGQIGHWYLPAGGETVELSSGAARIHGIDGSPSEIPLERLLAAYADEDAARLRRHIGDALREAGAFELEAGVRPAGGGHREVRVAGEIDLGADGRVEGLLVAVQDISEQRAAIAALAGLAAAQERQADFAESASDWLWEMGPDLRFTYLSPRVEQVVGVPAEFHIGKSRREMLGEGPLDPEMEGHLALLDRREPFRDFRFWRVGHDGRRQYIVTSGKPIFDAEGNFAGYRGSARDLTSEHLAKEKLIEANRELQLAKEQTEEALATLRQVNAALAERNAELVRAQADIRHAALHDALTGLPNRRFLDQKLAECYERCRTDGSMLGVLHLDLDRFKQINDTLGHGAGDAVLQHVATTLLQNVPTDDFIARVGGDEFVILCAGRRGERALERLAEALILALEGPLLHKGRECWFGVSIGISAAWGEAVATTELLVNADIALYRAKSQGRGCYEFFSTRVQREIVRYKSVADGVLAGLKRAEFVPYYQPQISAENFEIVGVEALARWRHPANGVLAPGSFLRVVEDLGVVAILDRMILEQAIDDRERWRAAGIEVPKLSVNISARRLLDPKMIEDFSRMTLPRGVLAFELLESVFLDEPSDTMAWNIDLLKDMGIEIELDDFGSGHASIVSLLKLGPDAIKIDRELVSSVTFDPRRCGLIRSIVEIARSLDVRIIAEGVETAGEAELLRDLGCNALQGFHFAAPMPAEAFPGFARDWARKNRSRTRKSG